MKKIRITLIKSVIDRPEIAKRTVAALGLKKLNANVEVEATPQILGMIRRAGHLIKVQELLNTEISIEKLPPEIFEDGLNLV